MLQPIPTDPQPSGDPVDARANERPAVTQAPEATLQRAVQHEARFRQGNEGNGKDECDRVEQMANER